MSGLTPQVDINIYTCHIGSYHIVIILLGCMIILTLILGDVTIFLHNSTTIPTLAITMMEYRNSGAGD